MRRRLRREGEAQVEARGEAQVRRAEEENKKKVPRWCVRTASLEAQEALAERGPSGREPSGSTRLSGRAARLGHEDRWKPKTTIAESDERPTSMDGGRGRFVLEKGRERTGSSP